MTSTPKINLHTHTIFSDGKNSPEEMILSAISKEFTCLGFSSHCMYPVSSEFYTKEDSNWHADNKKIPQYIEQIHELQKKYEDKIQIVLGFEAEYFKLADGTETIPSKENYSKFSPDYLIGSVHFVPKENGFYTVDNTPEAVNKALNDFYWNQELQKVEGKNAVCDYFEAEREMLRKGDFEILGHADLIRKNNGVLHFFDETESWYKEQIQQTVKAISKAGVIVEINTGAIARKLMNDVYPSEYFLHELNLAKVPVCVNSDSHTVNTLDTAFDFAYEQARKAGYTELVYPIKGKTISIKL